MMRRFCEICFTEIPDGERRWEINFAEKTEDRYSSRQDLKIGGTFEPPSVNFGDVCALCVLTIRDVITTRQRKSNSVRAVTE